MVTPFGAQKLILGGHTFLDELGNDPAANPREQAKILGACARGGIRVVDTTYAPERLGFFRTVNAIEDPGFRPIVWNFFEHPEMGDTLPGPDPWTEERFEMALDEIGLRTEAPFLVLHPLEDPVANRAQLEAVRRLRDEGRVIHPGFWINLSAGPEHREPAVRQWQQMLEVEDLWRFVVTPWNPTTSHGNGEILQVAKARGWATLGTSPFVRGWELEARAKRFARRRQLRLEDVLPRVADAMLRFAAFSDGLDHVVNAMRRSAHVEPNLQSIGRGPLSAEERQWLLDLG